MSEIPKFKKGGIISKELADKIRFDLMYPHQLPKPIADKTLNLLKELSIEELEKAIKYIHSKRKCRKRKN